MTDEAQRLRSEAEHCRTLMTSMYGATRTVDLLKRMAEEFDREAEKLEEADRRNEELKTARPFP